jgi:uncharacterized damage-inducible protein DinB
MSSVAHVLLAEFESEVPATHRVLERIPPERFDWQPHPRSMSAGQLALHVASIPGNVVRLAHLDGFDVATAPTSYPAADTRDALLSSFDRSVASMRALLNGLDDTTAAAPWRLTFGDREIANWTRFTLIRTMGLNHWYHHRGELMVYLRLLGVRVPVVYGRSADENPFAQTAA